MVIVAAALMAKVSEKISIRKPRIKLMIKKVVLFSFIGYQ
jgi:hypothetical protein